MLIGVTTKSSTKYVTLLDIGGGGELAIEHTTPGERHQDSREPSFTVFFNYSVL